MNNMEKLAMSTVLKGLGGLGAAGAGAYGLHKLFSGGPGPQPQVSNTGVGGSGNRGGVGGDTGEWPAHETSEGKKYYVDPATGKSQWNRYEQPQVDTARGAADAQDENVIAPRSDPSKYWWETGPSNAQTPIDYEAIDPGGPETVDSTTMNPGFRPDPNRSYNFSRENPWSTPYWQAPNPALHGPKGRGSYRPDGITPDYGSFHDDPRGVGAMYQ